MFNRIFIKVAGFRFEENISAIPVAERAASARLVRGWQSAQDVGSSLERAGKMLSPVVDRSFLATADSPCSNQHRK